MDREYFDITLPHITAALGGKDLNRANLAELAKLVDYELGDDTVDGYTRDICKVENKLKRLNDIHHR